MFKDDSDCKFGCGGGPFGAYSEPGVTFLVATITVCGGWRADLMSDLSTQEVQILTDNGYRKKLQHLSFTT